MHKVKIILQVQDPFGNQFILQVTSDEWGVLKYRLTDLTRSTGFAVSNMGFKSDPPITIHDYSSDRATEGNRRRDQQEQILTHLKMCINEHTTYSVNKTIAALTQTKDGVVKEIRNV